jgi:hypothetical protein
MALDHGPKIVTSGLVFSVDAADSNSYRSGSAFVYNTANLERSGSVSGSMGYSSQARGAFAFSGNGAAILFPEDSALNTQTVTVEVWTRTNAAVQSGFWFEKGNVNTQYSLFQEAAGNIVWRQASLSQYTSSSLYLNTTDWAQVVGTYTSGNRRTYVNGIVRTADTQTGSLSTNANGMSIGIYGGFNGGRGYSFNGNIGVIRVYNKTLTPQEVLQNYNEQLNRFRQ